MKKTQESGRSMVEMLGVLAIIGVLSIGGIAGYSMAMNRYRANEALDLATKYAVVLYSGKQTYDALHTGTSDSYKPLSLYAVGLTTTASVKSGTSSKTKTQTPGGAYIYTPENSDIKDGGVDITIDFGTDAVCKAALSILGETQDGNKCKTGDHKLKYTFKQS